MSITAIVRSERLIELRRNMAGRARQHVDNTADDIRTLAYQLAPRQTGSLAFSIYVSGPDASDYAQHASSAAALNPRAAIQREVRPVDVLSLSGGGTDGYTVVVGVAAGHGIFQELGTRYQGPQSFLIPATEPNRDAFVSAMSKIAE